MTCNIMCMFFKYLDKHCTLLCNTSNNGALIKIHYYYYYYYCYNY